MENRPVLERPAGPNARRPRSSAPRSAAALGAAGAEKAASHLTNVAPGVTIEELRRRRHELKAQARDWERAFRERHGDKPLYDDRKASPEYTTIRRRLKHADTALALSEKSSSNGATPADKEKLWREVHRSGLGPAPPARDRSRSRGASLAAAGRLSSEGERRDGDGDGQQLDETDERMDNRDEGGRLERAASGKLVKAASGPSEAAGSKVTVAIGVPVTDAAAEDAATGTAAGEVEEADGGMDVAHEHAPITPGRFTRYCVAYPCAIALLLLLASIFVCWAGVNPRNGTPELVQRQGWNTDTSAVTMASRAFGVLRADALQPSDPAVAAAVDGTDDEDEEDEEDEEVYKTNSQAIDTTTILYDAFEGGKVLSKAGVDAMIKFEKRILGVEGHSTYCQRAYSYDDEGKYACASPVTLLNYLHRNAKAHEQQCGRGFCYAGTSLRPMCESGILEWGVLPCVSTIYDWRDGTLADEADWPDLLSERLCHTAFRRSLLPVDAVCTKDETDLRTIRFARSFYALGWPLPGYTEDGSGKGNASDWASQWSELQGAEYTRLLKVELNKAQTELSMTPARASVYATTSEPGKPLSIVWTNRASGGLNDYILSDAIFATASFAFVFLYVAFNLRSLFLACCGMFEIVISLPIAYFVWKVLMGQSRISWLQILSVYILLCVGADDLFVFYDTWRMSLELPENVAGSLQTRFAWTFRRAALAMLTTTATTAICLFATAASPMGQMQAFGIFTALAIVADYVLVITFFPACVLIHAKHLTPCTRALHAACCCCCAGPSKKGTRARTGPHEGAAGRQQRLPPPKERRATRWLRDTLAPFIHKRRWPLLAAFSLLCVGAAVAVYLQLKPAEELKFFSAEHPVQKTIDINADEFVDADDWKHAVAVAYGLASPPITYVPSQELLRGEYNNDDPWALNYHSAADFDLRPSLQRAIAADCDAAKAMGIVANKEVYCLLNELRDAHPDDWPYGNGVELHDALVKFYGSSEHRALRDDHERYTWHTGFISSTDGKLGGKVRALWHSFNTTIPQTARPTPNSAGPHFKRWEDFVGERCASMGCVQSTRLWGFYDVLSSLYQFAFSTVLICVVCSFVVLLVATANALVALYATVTIIAVILCVLAGILLLGYEFGMFECIFIILTCGMAIDYAVHLAHFFTHASGTRQQRTTSALHGVGLSILGGAVTTMGAGFPQFFCVILFFRLNGTFIFLTSGVSLLFSFGMLLPLFMAIGPEGNQGEVLALCGKGHGDRFAARSGGTVARNAKSLQKNVRQRV